MEKEVSQIFHGRSKLLRCKMSLKHKCHLIQGFLLYFFLKKEICGKDEDKRTLIVALFMTKITFNKKEFVK